MKNLTFNSYPISFHKINEVDYIECKEVFIKIDSYFEWEKDKRKNLLGYNKEGKPCKIIIVNNLVKIGCLKDSLSNFKYIVNQVKNKLKNGKQN